MAAKKNNKDVTARTKGEVIPIPEEFDPQKTMDQIEPRLPQIGILHQEQMFKMPDGENVKSFKGVILDLNRANAFWKESFSESGGGTPPDCSSIDGIHADLNMEGACPSPTGKCGHGKDPECPHNKFGSDGRGKKCKNLKRVHILIDDQLLPMRLTLPPTSIKSIDLYVSLLMSQKLPMQLIETEFSLKESSNKEGISFSEAVFKNINRITDAKRVEELRLMFRQWRSIMRQQPVEGDEY